MFNISKLFVSLFGIGFFPIASGTIGSFFSLLFFYIFYKYLNSVSIILIFFLIFFLSLKFIKIYSKRIKKEDSSEIIIDEFLGINFIIIFYEYIKFTNDIAMFILIFFIFRFFDIIKTFPANWIDKNMKNPLGVIMDDIIAGFYTILVLYIIDAIL